MRLFKEKTTAETATASVADENGAHKHDDVGAQIDALEAAAEDDPAMKAAEALEGFTLTPGAKSLLDRAVDNIATSTGSGITDPELKQIISSRAALLAASGSDLSVAITAIVDSCTEDPQAISPMVYSLCYNVLKQAVFYANLDQRRYLDPKGDFDLTPYNLTRRVEDEAFGHDFAADQREELRDPPVGLDSAIEREWEYYREIYGVTVDTTEDIFAAALNDLRLFLQLTCESFGWEPDRPMPFANIANPDGTYTPINDAAQAIDHAEVTRKARMAERRAKDAVRMNAAAQRAAEIARKALAR